MRLSILIFIIHQIHSTPKYIFSLKNDHIHQLLHTNCSTLNAYSSLFICSNEIFYHIEFNLDISLVPFQSQLNTCGVIIKYNHKTNQSSFLLSHNNNQDPIIFNQRSILSIDVRIRSY
jgi:hypothetical protein